MDAKLIFPSVTVLLSVMFCSCHPAYTTLYDRSVQYPPVQMAEIYLDTSKIPFKFFRIGEVRGTRGMAVSDENEFWEIVESQLQDMIEEARNCGADGIIAIELFEHNILGFDRVAGLSTMQKTPETKGILIRFERDENGNPMKWDNTSPNE